MHLVGCLYYLYQSCTVKQISDNEIHLLIKYTKSVLWRVAKCLSYIEEARCLKVKHCHTSRQENKNANLAATSQSMWHMRFRRCFPPKCRYAPPPQQITAIWNTNFIRWLLSVVFPFGPFMINTSPYKLSSTAVLTHRRAMWWFLLRACNMAAPPSLNLLGEIGLLSSLVSWSRCLMLVLVLLSLLVLFILFIYILIVSMDLHKRQSAPLYRHWGSVQAVRPIGGVEV